MDRPHRIVFDEFGDPVDRVRVEGCDCPSPGPGQVLVSLLHTPINPADFNYIEGTYGLKPQAFPAVAGMEGAGEGATVGILGTWARGTPHGGVDGAGE